MKNTNDEMSAVSKYKKNQLLKTVLNNPVELNRLFYSISFRPNEITLQGEFINKNTLEFCCELEIGYCLTEEGNFEGNFMESGISIEIVLTD